MRSRPREAHRTADPESVAQLMRDSVAAVSPSGDRVLLHIPSGTYLKLDQTASTIVDLLVEYEGVAPAATALALQFSIPVERAEADVTSVVTTLRTLRASRTSPMRRPTVHGVLYIGRQWWSLPVELRGAVAKAAVVVAAVEVGLRISDIGTLATRMHVPLASGMADPPEESADGLAGLSAGEQRAYWATGWVLDRWNFPDTCLRRALVTGFFLRRHQPVLRLGLIGDGDTSHAWVEAEGMTFNATAVTGSFTAAAEA
jgi:Coenzyme PQQ synthesis protein D (PqqD)/Transglutaminase-like superfamily